MSRIILQHSSTDFSYLSEIMTDIMDNGIMDNGDSALGIMGIMGDNGDSALFLPAGPSYRKGAQPAPEFSFKFINKRLITQGPSAMRIRTDVG